MEKDADGTVAAWQAARADVIRPNTLDHSGKLVKLTGDGFLIEFPTVLDAVNCAIAVQMELVSSTLDFPIGVHMGDIIDDGEDIHGEGVNVAARLEGLADAGGICISGSVHEQVRNRIDVTYDDLGENKVKNVSAPVRVYAIRSGISAPASVSVEQIIADKPSIAVLPFDNLSGDPEQEYFSDGMAEDLITDLSKISSLFVIARNSSFTFKGQYIEVKEIAERLGVKYVLEGSVRKMGERLRINAQLIDGATSGHLWAERFDGDINEIFDFQDRIRGEIIAALELKLTPIDVANEARRRTTSIEAYDLLLKGRTSYFRYSPEGALDAKKYLEQAIGLDPDFAEAYSYLSVCYISARNFMWPGFDGGLEHPLKLAENGVALDPNSAIALAKLGWVRMFLRRYEEAKSSFEKALSLAPDNAEAHAYYGVVLNFSGEPENGRQHLQTAIQLDPLLPPSYSGMIGATHYQMRQYEAAFSFVSRAVEQAPGHLFVQVLMAATLVKMNRLEDAANHMTAVLEAFPRVSIDHIQKVFHFAKWKTKDDSSTPSGKPDCRKANDR
jgi:adenylate cyclase